VTNCQLPIANCQFELSRPFVVANDSPMNPEELKNRTKKFAIRVLNLADQLPRGVKGRVLSDQIARAGTSAAANYRAACKARSRREFIAKVGIAEEEADEVQFRLELTCEDKLVPANRLKDLH
jgi:four helix bundle protein